MECKYHPTTNLKGGGCPICQWRPPAASSARSAGPERRVFTAPPDDEAFKRIKEGKIRAVYRCCRCNRTSPEFQLVTCAGEYFCIEHYDDRRVELAYPSNGEKAFPPSFRTQLLSEVVAQRPQYKRAAGESRSEYVHRMIGIAKEKARALSEKLKVGT